MSSLFSTIKVGGWTFASRILGLLRDMATTNLLGASVFHDVFVVVLKIPNVFRRFFAEGAFSQAFIPIYKSLISKNKETEASAFLNSLLGLMITVLFFFTVAALIFAPIFIFFFAPGFYFDSETKSLAVEMLRIMFPYLALISLVSFAAGIQNSHNSFSVPAATPLIFNFTLIIFAVFVSRFFEIPVFALAWGVLLAGFLQLLLQMVPLTRIGIIPKIAFDFKNQHIRRFGLLILPAILAGGVAQINLLIDTIFASLLSPGSPTWLYVSDRLIQFPLGVFAIAIGTVLLPNLTQHFANENLLEFKSTLMKGIKLVIFIGIPSSLGLAIFGYQILEMLFQRGAFTANDVMMANLGLQMFTIGLPFFMLMKVLVPCFFAQQNTKTPLYVAILSLLINIILNYLFAFYLGFGHYGLALGSSLAAVVSVMILLMILSFEKLIFISLDFIKFIFKISFATSLMVLYLLAVTDLVNFSILNGMFYVISILLVICVAALIFLLASYVLGIRPKDLYQ